MPLKNSSMFDLPILSSPAARLRWAREHAGFSSLRDAVEAKGFVYPTYAQHEDGKRGFTKKAALYAKAFGVSESWLLTGENNSRQFPVYAAVLASVSHHGLMRTNEPIAKLPVTPGLNKRPRAYGMLVEGHSMAPCLRPDDLIIADPDEYPRPGDMAVFCEPRSANGRPIYFVKVFDRKGDDGIYAHQYNNHGLSVNDDEEINIKFKDPETTCHRILRLREIFDM